MGTYSLEGFKAKVERWGRQSIIAIQNAKRRAAENIKRYAKTRHLSGPRMPKGVGSSRHGTLARETGALASSVRTQVKRDGNDIRAYIMAGGGQARQYAMVHEFGSKNIPRRSFIYPSVNAKRRSTLKLIMEALRKSWRRSG